MNVIEATKAAYEKGAYMKRNGDSWSRSTKIKPTNFGYEVEIVYIPFHGETRVGCSMWNLKPEDVLANDWIVCN